MPHLQSEMEAIKNAKCNTFFSIAAKDSSLLGCYIMSPGTFYRRVEELYCPRLQFRAFRNVELKCLTLVR